MQGSGRSEHFLVDCRAKICNKIPIWLWVADSEKNSLAKIQNQISNSPRLVLACAWLLGLQVRASPAVLGSVPEGLRTRVTSSYKRENREKPLVEVSGLTRATAADLTVAIEYEVCEHEIDDWASAGHRGPASEPDEASFADGCVAQPFRTMQGVQAFGSEEVPPSYSDTFSHNKDIWITRHLLR